MKQKPLKELRDGSIKATIWENASKKADSKPFHTISFSRIYKVEATWKETSSFGREDLLKVQHLAQEAYRFLAELEASAPKAKAKTKNA